MNTINWSKYNNDLISRGKVSVWFDEQLEETWYATNTGGAGFQKRYSDSTIEALLIIGHVYGLTLRETKGLALDLVKLMGMKVIIPCYTTLCRRQKKLFVSIQQKVKQGETIHIVVDSTGLKIFGEGEWKVRKHGYEKRRTWRKLHLAVDEASNQIVAAELTGNDTGDSEVFEGLINEASANGFTISQITGDGAYDVKDLYAYCYLLGCLGVFPPRAGAKIEKHGNTKGDKLTRDEHIRSISKDGLKNWKEEQSYHRRSLAETAMFRFKSKFGPNLKSRDFLSQQNESRLKVNILNRMKTPVYDSKSV